MFIEWFKHGKPSVLGIATGAIAGLAAVTPAAGVIGPMGGFGIGLASGVICFLASTTLKSKMGYDDSLDVFGVHGVGGFVGTVLAGVFGATALGGLGLDRSIGEQVGVQLAAGLLTAAWAAIAGFALLKITDAIVGLRIDEESESTGLDISEHEERGYNL